jgi:Zn-dependent peptidase ImmA (M78 family)
MEQIKAINPKRVEWCCADYGIMADDLAAKAGIAPATMEQFMAGEGGLTFPQLRDVARYFGRGVLFFMEEGPVDETQVHTAQFRTLANQKPELTPKLKKLIEEVEKQRELYVSLLEDLDETDRLDFRPPELPRDDPKVAAAIARKWLGLPERNSFDSYRRAVEARGVLVFRSNGYNGTWQIPKDCPILGFTLYDPVCPVIVVKKLPWETQQCFTLMHELGHLLLHRASSIDDERDLQSTGGHERDANAFAGHLLVPDDFLPDINDRDKPSDVAGFDEWLKPQRAAWGVSAEVILRRLLDEGRLTAQDYRDYRHWRKGLIVREQTGGAREYRHREPLHMFGQAFVGTVLDALNARRITLAKASSYLDNLKIKDLHALEHYHAGS